MKLFIHDEKHDRVLGTLDLGEVGFVKERMVGDIILFLEEHGLSTRYHRLILANGYTQVTDEDAPDYGITFHWS